MTPPPQASWGTGAVLERPGLLNEKFKVHSYDGGCFKSKPMYDIKNVLIPILEPFHCSGSGNRFNLVLKCPDDFTLTHFYISGPGPRCTEPIKSGLVWVLDNPPDVEQSKKYDHMSSEELCEIVKGFRAVGSADEESGLPDPCVYFTTDGTSREAEVELSKWREGRHILLKFLDTHKAAANIDVAIIGLIGFWGKHAKQQVPLGPWMRREVQQVWVHANPLKSMFSSSGWVCDGRDFTGGCRCGQTDFHQTNVYTVTFRCSTSGFDLCESCAYDPSLGKITDTSIQADLEALANPTTCKLAVTRIRNQCRRNWLASLPKYFGQGLLDSLIQTLHKSTEGSGSRSDEERLVSLRSVPQSSAESQKRAVRRAALQLTTELTLRLFGLCQGGDLAPNDLVWALSSDPEEHWDEGRVVQLPKASDGFAPPTGMSTANSTLGASSDFAQMILGASENPSEAGDAPVGSMQAGMLRGASEMAASAQAALEESTPCDVMVSWRDGVAPCRVPLKNVWRMIGDEEVMTATAQLFLEVCKGPTCEMDAVDKWLTQGADLMACNGEGSTVLLGAVLAGCPVEVITHLLESGGCPDVSGKDGLTPLMQVTSMQQRPGASKHLSAVREVLLRYGATEVQEPGQVLERMQETYGLKMLGALLTLQSPASLPWEVLEVIHLLFRELPLRIVKQALEPVAFRALVALFQHFVGGVDHLSSAYLGCRIMRSVFQQGDTTLQYLVRSHGASRWAHRLASIKDVAQCGLYRAPHHERVSQEELSREAMALVEVLDKQQTQAEDGKDEDWKANFQLVEIVAALDEKADAGDQEASAKEAMMSFRELLKKSEKCSLSEDRCTAYELERSDMPGLLCRFLQRQAVPAASLDPIRQPAMNVDRWVCFKEIFSEQTKQTRKGLVRLVKALHAVIETAEALPVWRHKKERGLKALTEPIPLKLRPLKNNDFVAPILPETMQPQALVMVEPLVQLSELTQYLLRVTPVTDARYLAECFALVGGTIRETSSGELMSILAFEVLHADLPLPIHTVRRAKSGETQRVLLSAVDHQLVSKSSTTLPLTNLHVGLCRLQATAGLKAYGPLLDELTATLHGHVVSQSADEGQQKDERVQKVWQEILSLASTNMAEALLVVASEHARICGLSSPSGDGEGGEGGGDGVEPSMRVHTVMIIVSDEVPFELFWPMVRDDILAAVREFYPRGVPSQLEEQVQGGVAQSGMGPVAQKLSLEEAETLAARVGHVVQTAVVVDQAALQEAQRAAAKGNPNAEAIVVGRRVQFSPKGGKEWLPAVVVGRISGGPSGPRAGANDKFDLIDDHGVLWERWPRNRLRVPANRQELSGHLPPVLSQQDLVRIREHLRKRQEQWAERHSSNTAGAGGGTARGEASAPAEPSGSGAQGSGGRPTSAPATSQRPRASSGVIDARAPLLEAGILARGRRPDSSGTTMSSREESIGEGDPQSALEMVQFMEDFDDGDGRGCEDGDEDEEDYDENEGRDDGEDDEDLPQLEPSEAGDSTGDVMPGSRLGVRSREGDGDGGPGMDEEMRVMEQLRAMEQLISEVLEPQETGGGGRHRRDPSHAEELLNSPMANLRMRMGSLGDGIVEAYQMRRSASAGGSRSSARDRPPAVEPIRGDFPAFVRAADLANPTSSLDHPVAERLGCDDLAEDFNDDDPIVEDTDESQSLLKLRPRFCLYPKGEVDESALQPVVLPPTWNLMKVMQFFHDQQQKAQTLDADGTGCSGAPPCVMATQKLALDGWSLGYTWLPEESQTTVDMDTRDMDVDSKAQSPRRRMEDLPASTPDRRGRYPARKRRRVQHGMADEVAREMYTRFAAAEAEAGQIVTGPHEVIAKCGESQAVNDAIELLHLLKAQGPGLGIEPNIWVSSKLDRKLRYQLEDPLSVVSGTLPLWATTLPRLCPFLFSLNTRKMLLKYTAFGPSFAVHWTQENKVGSFLRRRATVQTELNAQSDPRKIQKLSQELSNIEEHVVKSTFWLGSLQSTLVKMQKGEALLQQSEVAMDLVATAGHLVEVQFDGENGFGSAVTQSFYVEVARDLTERESNKRLPLWLADDQSGPGCLTNRRGLTIQPLAAGPIKDEAVRRFRFLGRLMGQALREGFIVPLPLAEDFFGLVLGESLGPSNFPRPGSSSAGELCGVLADFVADLTSSQAQSTLEEIHAWKLEQAARTDFGERFLAYDGVDNQVYKGMSFTQYLEAGCASFLATGVGGDPLVPNGENIPITIDNVEDFVAKASELWFHSGVAAQVEAFRAGLNDVFPFACLVAFSRSELRELFCGEDRIEWDEQALLQHLHPVGGLTDKSPAYKYLVADLIEMNQADRSRFLDFVSSCPRLPPGGMAKFHVDVFPDTTSKQGFPRSRACANQLYLPQYGSKEELHEKLHEAMHSSFGHHEQRARD